MNFNLRKGAFCSLLLTCFAAGISAQTVSDAIMMKQKEICAALVYEHGSFDHYWEGTYLRTNGTIQTVKINSVAAMAAIGLHNRVNLLVSVPYVQTKSTVPNGGFFKGAKGFQDISLALKGQILEKQLGAGKLALLATAGFSTPLTNYLSDYRPYSIGFGANEYNGRAILQYKLDKGLYLRSSPAYLHRGQTKAERDYYYNNGSYYTPWMDVPSAWNFDAIIGYWMLNYQLKVEANYVGLKSTSGDDVRPYNAAQPTNKVQFDQVGASVQYYPKSFKGLGGLLYIRQLINGRNTGKVTSFGAGLTYQFKI